jgi:DNA polymerase III subunit delta
MAWAPPSGPWGQEALRDLEQRLAKGWPAGLTVLTGDDLYHLDRAYEALFDHLVPDRNDAYAWTVLGESPVTTDSLVGAARSSGMFASSRVVVMRDVAALEGEPDPLVAFAADPPKASYLLVRAPRLDRKRKLHKALAEAGTCIVFRAPSSDAELAALAREIGELAAARGLTLDPAATAMLLAVCGVDLTRIVSELDKLHAWRGVGTKPVSVDAAAMRDSVAGAALLSGWELADALLERDPARAAEAARRLIDAGEEPIKVIGGLAYRARALIQAHGAQAAGARGEAALKAVKGSWFFRDALTAGLKRYTLAEALAMPGRLLAADRTLKSRGIDKGAVLERLVAEITGPPRENAR